jgi:hypothetical protein
VFDGSAAIANVYSCAALSHCCAVSYFRPCLKCESPFLAITVKGMTNRQQVKRSETNVRILIVDLIGNISRGGWNLDSDLAAGKARTQASRGLFFLHAPENSRFPTILCDWTLSRMQVTN